VSAIGFLLAASSIVLPVRTAHAETTLTIDNTHLNSDGSVQVSGTYSCDAQGGAQTLVVTITEQMVAGTSRQQLTCSTSNHTYTIVVSPLDGPFTSGGTATETAALVDANGQTIEGATETETVTIE